MTGRKIHYCLLIAVLILSAYVHLWNPMGFPDIFFDEGIYMRRAVNLMETGNLQESHLYDHPYFGQMVLAGFMKLVGFPETVQNSLEASYLAPRILMGLFAVLDTFLIYKISENRFGKRTAIISSILFAAMPITWMFRRILLDTILMPFLLSSILLALYSNEKRPTLMIVCSSVLLGLAVFTKVTAVVMVPVVAFIILSNHRFAGLAKWLPPVFLIPTMWPLTAVYLQQTGLWLEGVFWQAGRSSGRFWHVTGTVFAIDPVLMGLGFMGFACATLRRNVFLLLWIAPFMIFVGMVGFLQYFHYILILPPMCVAAAYMLDTCMTKIKKINLQKYMYAGVIIALASYGTIASSSIFSVDLTEPQFSAMQHTIDTFDDTQYTLIASPVYSWILSYVHGNDNVFLDYGDVLFYEPKTDSIYLIVDSHFLLDWQRGVEISEALQDAKLIKTFSTNIPDHTFPHGSYMVTSESQYVEIKIGRKDSMP